MKARRVKKYFIGIPISTWMVLFVILPLIIVVQYSFYLKTGPAYFDKDIFTFANYTHFFTHSIYLQVFFKTLLFALCISMISLLLGYPLAYLVSRKMKRFRNQLFLLIMVPLWMSYLVQIIAWRTILGKVGVINTVLMTIGVIDEPISWLIYSPFSVIITLVHITIPFVFIPIFNALEKIPNNLIAAAADLGANGFKQFREVIFPLSLPGVLVGFTMAFVISLGDYIIPKQLGGTSMVMFGNLIADQFGTAYNWPFGSALGFILFIVAITVLTLSTRLGKSEGFME